MSLGFCFVNLEKTVNSAVYVTPLEGTNDGSEVERFWGTEKGIRETAFAQQVDNVYYIRTAGQLAYMSYAITAAGAIDPSGSSWDFAGSVFVLENDINLNDIEIVNIEKTVYPYWTPIDIGPYGKNKNISFNGNGHNIIGMRIKYDHVNTARNAGFFANMVGGVFENVNFVNPTIIYSYSGTSIPETDSSRPDKPTDICVGVVAGAANSTYIKNVNIVNPTIMFNSGNLNAHNFCVGTAVGKLSFTTEFDDHHKISSINSAAPKQWGLDTVNVKENHELDSRYKFDSSVHPAITMTIENGTASGTTFGQATYGYLGGLAGVNISSKIINSSLNNLSVTPQISNSADGTYYIGGIAGLTTQITTSQSLIVAAGIYNNLLMNVKLGHILNTDVDTRYCGDLVGRVYSGGWVYNNLFIGNQAYSYVDNNEVKHLQLWEDVSNALIYLGEEAMDSDDCVGHLLGGLDLYYFKNNKDYIGDTGCHYAKNSSGYVYCTIHQSDPIPLNETGSAYGTEPIMREHNFHFFSLNDTDYQEFFGENGVYSLMSNIEADEGLLYDAALPIMKYEIGLTIDEIDPDTGLAPNDYAKLLNAVNQFRAWSKLGNQPILGSYYGADCSVKFIANAQSTISEAYFEEVTSYGYVTRSPEKMMARSFQQLIVKPKDPECEGYEFKGWKIPGWEEPGADLSTCPYYPTYVDGDGFYQFGLERVTTPGREFVAIWEIKEFTASYMLRQYSANGDSYEDIPFAAKPSETVTFATTLKGVNVDDQPTSNQGLVFVGWFLEENLPAFGEDANSNLQWVFGHDGNKMPGKNIKLYAGWINNFTMLSQLLDNEVYINYYINYDKYFNDALGRAYYDAYRSAYEARSNGDTSNASVYLNMLQYTFANLRIDPKKILETPAFDDLKVENTCPFLYDYNVYLSYLTFKKIVEKNAKVDADEATLKNINGFIKDYEKLDELFNSLKSNLRSSVEAVGGINSTEIKNLIEKYRDLEERYENLYANNEYKNYDMTALEDAKKKANENWMKKDGEVVLEKNVVLKDVESVIADYETAFNNLKPKNASIDEGTGNFGNKKSNRALLLGMSPVLFSIIVVSVLAALAFGYIGIDVALNKRRVQTKVKNKVETEEQVPTPDDETYI
ncbi:MAG: hypothetical protein MJ060_03160 [Clostridia bacterium]|nr:hypothetical protein [Clostridia bacterium]